jgi:UDP-N-acetyl-D-galactosamine dehydrogenase
LRKIGVVGLGYVGLPAAMALAEKFEVIGYDINKERIQQLHDGVDKTGELEEGELSGSTLAFTCNIDDLKKCDFFIIGVPTPVDTSNRPDLTAVESASKAVASILKSGDIVVYETTVYPGVTEEVCGPILEDLSGLKSGIDFKLGYSPERINPGDKEHTFKTIKKVVSGQDQESLRIISDIYGAVVTAGVHEAPTIKVAEAAKVIENTQRDINIAFVNELALIFDRLDIDTKDVLEAASTKWNFLSFFPGLVGGHCIGVDPYYLTHKAEEVGYHPQVILSGRRINDSMGQYIAHRAIKKLIQHDAKIKDTDINILGATFKENCPDLRNSKVKDISDELKKYGVNPILIDPVCDSEELTSVYSSGNVSTIDNPKKTKVMILAVPHKQLLNEDLKKFVEQDGIIIDVKGCLNRQEWEGEGYDYWRL